MSVKFRDYYEILGVGKNATPQEIKSAFRKLARKHHPDTAAPSHKKGAAEKFNEINEAYEVLSDPEKKKKYDRYGANYREGMDFTPPPGFGEGTFRSSSSTGEFGGMGSFSDFFESIFGGGRGEGTQWRASTQQRSVKGEDVEAEIELALEDAHRGGAKKISLETVQGRKHLEVKIPAGVHEGSRIRLAGQGHPDGGNPGDLYLTVKIKAHPLFKCEGDDILMVQSVFPWDAALGTELQVPTLDGPVKLNIPPGSQAGKKLRLKEKGLLKKKGGRGDFFVVLQITLPDKISEKERELYEQLKHLASK